MWGGFFVLLSLIFITGGFALEVPLQSEGNSTVILSLHQPTEWHGENLSLMLSLAETSNNNTRALVSITFEGVEKKVLLTRGVAQVLDVSVEKKSSVELMFVDMQGRNVHVEIHTARGFPEKESSSDGLLFPLVVGVISLLIVAVALILWRRLSEQKIAPASSTSS